MTMIAWLKMVSMASLGLQEKIALLGAELKPKYACRIRFLNTEKSADSALIPS